MLHRSAGKPILIGLGAAAIIAAGAVPVLAAPPAPPVSTPSEASATAGKTVEVTSTVQPFASEEAKSYEGMSVKIAVTDPAQVADINCPEGSKVAEGGCDLGSIPGADPADVTSTVSVDKDLPRKTEVTLTVTLTRKVGDAAAETAEDTTTITFNPIPKPPPPPPSPTPTKSSSSPSPSPTKSSDSSDKDDDDDEGSTSSGSGSSGTGAGSSSYTPPVPNGAFAAPQNPQVALPPVAPLSPSVAPQATPTPESRLQNNKAPVAQDLTFERMASTQVAWLAALLVAFSVLMTQLRLGRRRDVSARALATTGRPAGSHRRPRRGLFSK